MALPTDFHFTASSLQDYVDCPRRFQLRFQRRLAWPSVQSEPAEEFERWLQQGSAFHRLVQQRLSGIPLERLERLATGDNLRRWWRNYLESGPADLPPARYPEIELSGTLEDYRLAAKYDLVAVEEGKRAVIVDWKTAAKRPTREWLAARLQTRVYPCLLVLAGAGLNGGAPLLPEQVEMMYWFAEFPVQPERFAYDAEQQEKDETYLRGLVAEIAGLEDGAFPMTDDEQSCRYCVYRSLCDRGIAAGPLDEADAEGDLAAEFDLDFDQIAEVEY